MARWRLTMVLALVPCRGVVAASANHPRVPLRVGLIKFQYLPWIMLDNPQLLASTHSDYIGGFFVDFYREMGTVGNFEMTFVPIEDDNHMNDFTGVSMRLLDSRDIDLAFAPDQLLSDTYGDRYMFTMPILTFPHVVLTRKTSASVGMWQVFSPFEDSLWLAILGSVGFGALVLWALQAVDLGRYSARMLPTYAYHTAVAMFGGDEFDLYHCIAGHALSGRLYRVGLLFMVMVFGATYTANLAAFFTRPAFTVHGPSSMDDLRQTDVCYRWRAQLAANGLRPYVRSVLTPPAKMDNDIVQREPWAREKLHAGDCGAIVELQTNAKSEALEHCDTLAYNQDIAILPVTDYNIMRGPGNTGNGTGTGGAAAAADLALWRRVNQAVLLTLRERRYAEMVARNFRLGQSCPAADRSLEKITVGQMSGAFVIFGAIGLAAVALAAASKAQRRGAGGVSVEEGETESQEDVHNEQLDRKLDRVLAELRRLRSGGSGADAGPDSTSTPTHPTPLPAPAPLPPLPPLACTDKFSL